MSAKHHSSPGSRKLGGCRGKYPTAIPTATCVQACYPYHAPHQGPHQVPYYQELSSAAAVLWKAQNNSLKTKKVSELYSLIILTPILRIC